MSFCIGFIGSNSISGVPMRCREAIRPGWHSEEGGGWKKVKTKKNMCVYVFWRSKPFWREPVVRLYVLLNRAPTCIEALYIMAHLLRKSTYILY